VARTLHQTATRDRVHTAARIEDWWQSWRVRVATRRGLVPQVIAFRGLGTTGKVRVLARVVMAKPPKHDALAPRKIRGWRSFTSAPVPFAPVTVQIDSHVREVKADRGGVIDTDLALELEPGWHNTWFRVGNGLAVRGRVFVVDDSQEIGIVCDVDDTIMVTALPRPFLAAWNSFVRDEHARRPVPGMAVLLERIVRQYPGCPVVYLSTGAWNVQPTLTRFLKRHLYPMGVLLLTDWGPTPERFFRSGTQHKRESLRRLASDFPGLRWILIGDDGQHDEELYQDFAQTHPHQVRAVAIRELLAPEALFAGGRSHRNRTEDPEEIPWVSAPNGAGLAAELAHLGVIEWPSHSPE
jgi:phosphatidate phosphatase APP1